jgi:hypothetical protein
MKSSKVRKESGRKYNKFYNPEIGEYNEQYWNDWIDYRDGFRNTNSDYTKIKPKFIKNEHWPENNFNRNKKLKTQNKIRKYKKFKTQFD